MDTAQKEIFRKIKDHRTIILGTNGDNGYPSLRFVMVVAPAPDGELWVATGAGTRKTAEIKRDPRVTVLWSDFNKWHNFYLEGTAEVIEDPAIKTKMWHDNWSYYWPEGPTSPSYVLLKITPLRGKLFDNEEGKSIEVQF